MNKYRSLHSIFILLFIFSSFAISIQAQTAMANGSAVVPPLVKFSGILMDVDSKPLTGVVGVTFALYRDQQGGAPLWLETQNVQLDQSGHYSIMLGSTSNTGLPAEIFVGGEARWLGIQPQGQGEQPRVLLLSVPYALKAEDAQTLGGLPPSAFVLAAPSAGIASASKNANSRPATVGASTALDVITPGGTVNYLPLWDTTNDIVSSVLFQSGSGTTAKVGIGTTTPAATLDVNGGATIRGLLNLPSAATATATAGSDSRPFGLVASTYNSGTHAAANQAFHWQAEPTANNTSSPSATLNLLFATAPAVAAETGLHIASNGKITFAAGQTFPGAGTITGVAAGTDLTGGGTTGSVTLNVDTTKIPQLTGTNTFVGNQAITGSLSATGSITGQTGTYSSNSTGVTLTVTQAGSGDGINVNALKGSTGILANANDLGISGNANFTGGGGIGVLGSATNGFGVYGQDLAKTGTSVGLYGVTLSTAGIGVAGQASASGAGSSIGVYGASSGEAFEGADQSITVGVEGVATGIYGYGGVFNGGPAGLVGDLNDSGGTGLMANGGNDTTSSGNGGGYGAMIQGGSSNASFGGDSIYSQGGFGNTRGGNGGTFFGGVSIESNGTAGFGIRAVAGEGLGFSGSGTSASPIAGVAGFTPAGADGPDGPGVFGSDTQGGTSTTGASFVGDDFGVWGDTTGGISGVFATADVATALQAYNLSTSNPAALAYNLTTSAAAPAFQTTTNGVVGYATFGGSGCGGNYFGLQLGGLGMTNCNNYTMLGDSLNTYINAGSNTGGNKAGSIFLRVLNGNALTVNTDKSITTSGNLTVDGTLKVVGTKNFMIDHPLDPSNKYLYHAAIESSEVLNLYSGNVSLDASGTAVVNLPDWFEAINKDFRYQLTAIGAPGRDLYIAEEVSGGKFKIAGGPPNGRVSWQVTGVRNDAWEKAHPMVVEADKGVERGHYLSPELYGADEEERVGSAVPIPSELPTKKDLILRAASTLRAVPAVRRPMMRPRPRLPVLPKRLPVRNASPQVPSKPQIAQASK